MAVKTGASAKSAKGKGKEKNGKGLTAAPLRVFSFKSLCLPVQILRFALFALLFAFSAWLFFTFVFFLFTFASMASRQWKLAQRSLPYGERTLVMGVLNVTPDSFSDGGEFFSLDRALAHAEQMIAEGADIIDVGGESTRPGSLPVVDEEELRRVIPVIESLIAKASVPISIDTTKSLVARAALEAGAEIVNDISGLRFDPSLADETAKARAGLVLMHSRGTPKTMQQLPPVADIMSDVIGSLRNSLAMAEERGMARESIAIDPGIGFGKTAEQNVELLARLDQLPREFPDVPIMIGTSRKSFIGKLHVKAAVEAVRVADAINLTWKGLYTP